jgi:hypothetical protein
MTLAPLPQLIDGRHPAFWRHNGQWRADRIAHLSRRAKQWIRRGAREADAASGYLAGNRLVSAVSVALRSAVTAYDEDEIESRARANAHHCALVPFDQARAFAEARGLRLPAGPNVTPSGLHARLRDAGFWRRQLRAIYGRAAECAYRDLGRVHRHEDPYLTNDGLDRYLQQRARAQRFLESTDAVCEETGEVFSLADLAARSLACEANRRGELMVRVRGMEEFALAAGHSWMFLTLTCPSAFHPRMAASGAPNPSYVRSTVRDARDLLQRLWARVRAKAKRLGLTFYGIRTAEPHHDGTPHWHLMLFGPTRHLEALWEVIRSHWYGVNPGELTSDAARDARALRKLPDPAKGESAAGYIVKYIAKGIDGHRLDGDDQAETDLSGTEAALRVVAWARLHGIRQFQQIGGPRVGLYRELRRIREPVAEPALEVARLAADACEFAAFWRAASAVHLIKQVPTCIDVSGAVKVRPNSWGEDSPPRVVGVQCVGRSGKLVRVCTRDKTWSRVRRVSGSVSGLGPVGTTVRGALGDRGRAPPTGRWSDHLAPRPDCDDRSGRLTCYAGREYGPKEPCEVEPNPLRSGLGGVRSEGGGEPGLGVPAGNVNPTGASAPLCADRGGNP